METCGKSDGRMADSAKALTTSKLKTCRHGIQLIVKGMNKLFSLVWVLCITAVAIIGFFMYTRLVPLKGLRNYNANDFEKEIERSSNHVLIDVREKTEYSKGFIPGAVNIPLSELKRRLDEVPKNREILLYCRGGMRSKQAAFILKKNGYTKISQLQGGILSWKGSIQQLS